MRAWLLGSPFPIAVISDHKNLEYFMSSRVLNRCQACWAMFLSDFDFSLSWAPGKGNIADAPSRQPNFFPQKGDATLLGQKRIILTTKHTESLPWTSLNAITTLSIDNLALLKCFKTAF
jgi:hypothetical protein